MAGVDESEKRRGEGRGRGRCIQEWEGGKGMKG